MKRIKLFTNLAFEKYINNYGYKHKHEDRWDSLDLDDITTDVAAPTQGEINAAIRELDLIDDAVANGASRKVKSNGEIEVTVDPRIAGLDIADTPKQHAARRKQHDEIQPDARAAGLDIDDNPSPELDHSQDTKIRELDIDDDNSDASFSKNPDSNLGTMGVLDYDDDIDTTTLVANIEDVYTGLTSPDGNIVQSLIKKYANDITDTERLKEIMLTHAIQGNYESLRAVCGDMTMTLTAKEKELGYIKKEDVDRLLRRLRKIARSLTGANNTYGLIPNAIVNCTPTEQIKYVNIVDFLAETLYIPMQPIFYRGAFVKHCYDLADYILEELPKGSITPELVFGRNGLMKRIAGYSDIPAKTINNLIDKLFENNAAIKKAKSSELGDLIIACINSSSAIKRIKNAIDFSSSKGGLVYDYLEDSGKLTEEQLAQFAE